MVKWAHRNMKAYDKNMYGMQISLHSNIILILDFWKEEDNIFVQNLQKMNEISNNFLTTISAITSDNSFLPPENPTFYNDCHVFTTLVFMK